MGDLRQDLSYAARTLRSAPGFAAAVIATLALGIGAAAAIFSIVNGVLLRPLPFPHGERIVRLFQVNAKGGRESVSQPNFQDWSARTRSFASLTLWGHEKITMQTPAGPVIAPVSMVSRDFFAVLGVAPALGRGFTPEETRFGGRRAAIISDAFWRAQFGGDPAVLGQRITMGLLTASESYEIVGVLPPAARYPAGNDVWVPLELLPPNTGRTAQGWSVMARLEPGVSPELAQRDLSAVSRQLARELGNETTMADATLVGLREQMVGDVRSRLLLLLAASAFLLLIGLANAANLLMARLAVRQGELAVRVALGATAGRLTRQVLAESALLVSIAAACGVALATLGVRLVVHASAAMLPRATEISVNWTVLGFAVLLAAAVALVLGLTAAWRSTRRDVRDALSASPRATSGAGSSARLRRAMVAGQLALTVVLLVGGGLLGRGFLRLLEVNPGFATQHLLVAEASPTIDDPTARLAYYTTLISRVRALPGVVAVGAATGVPLAVSAADGGFLLLDNAAQQVTLADWTAFPASRKGHAEYRIVDGDYFAAMGIPLLRGRLFQPTDRMDGPHVGVVSALLAARTWPGENPIGKVVEYGNMDGDLRPFTVVGVVGDVRHDNLADPPTPTFYGYFPQRTGAWRLALVARTRGDPSGIVASVRRIVHDLRPEVAVRARTIDRVIAESVADRRFMLFVIVAFAGTALLLATLGVYSLMSYLVAQRRREMGIRLALGAQRADVLALVVSEGVRLALAGIVVGVAASLLAARLIRGLVYGVSVTDPLAYAGAVALLALVAVVASYVPGRRATRVQPSEVLRGG